MIPDLQIHLPRAVIILTVVFQVQSFNISSKRNNTPSFWKSKQSNFTHEFSFTKSGGKAGRVKRYIGTDTLFFKESELQIRDRIGRGTKLDIALLPKFPGKEAGKPYTNLIQVLTHTRSYQDGAVDGAYGQTTADTISVAVDPEIHRFTKGKWTFYAGSRHHRCLLQTIYGNGYKAVFDCFTEGTYHAFFRIEGTYKDEKDIIDGIPFRPPEESLVHFDVDRFNSFVIDPRMFFTEYEQALLQDPASLLNPWYYSDPIKIVKDSYCYRWTYRIIKDNEVGFVHLEPNPVAISGVYKEYTLKVWIVDPSEVSQEELYSPINLNPSGYSQIITRRFFLGGLVPCLRHAHPAVEVVSDAVYVNVGEVQRSRGRVDSASLLGPHWRFHIKVYMDRVASSLSDITFTISPRQHTALYECFISDVRVYIPPKSYVFLPNSQVRSTAINLKYSWFSEVERRFLSENILHYYGHEAIYVGSPFLKTRENSVNLFSNPCINQEFAVAYSGTIGMTSDFFSKDELQSIRLPSFDKNRLGLNPATLQLSEAQRLVQAERSNNITYAKDKSLRIRVLDFAYDPVDVIFLLEDSSLYLHSTDLSLRGIGYNTITRKYKLGQLVKRKWCARTSTSKSHNMWIPGFSRPHGNFIVIYHIPAEGNLVVKQEEASTGCEIIRDSTKFGRREENTKFLTEKEIHADEADDARIDRAVEAKLRTKAAELKALNRERSKVVPKIRRRQDVENDKTFWLVGNEVLSANDPHYSSGATNARNVRVAHSGLEHYNDNVVYQIDTDFSKLRASFEANGLSFDMDELVYSSTNTLIRAAPNTRLFALHSVQFTGVEKRYLLAVGLQSQEFPKTVALRNSTLLMVTTFLANDLPVVVNGTTSERDVLLDKVDISFSGSLIRRLQNCHAQADCDINGLTDSDFVDAQGRDITPAPLSRITIKVNSINTALPFYVLRLNDVILFASLDGSFAKPILCYEDYPIPEQDVTPKPYLPFRSFDLLVTEQGVISALSQKEKAGLDPVAPSSAFIGTVLANEPLRYIHPFHLSNNIFQVATEEGEIVYGQLSYNQETEFMESPPKTKMLNIPFWSLLKGSFARSAGEANIPLDRHIASGGRRSTDSYADPICPFASFDVYYVAFPYIEARYTTRITAEVAFYGDVIPLEADVIVEFAEVQGVSVVVSSFLEVEYDQTTIRKTIEIETFLPQPQLEDMYNQHSTFQSDEEGSSLIEQVQVFTLTIRPSLINLHCQKKDYFRTIQMNVGCVPFTRMRLIAEALPLKKIEVQPWRVGLTKQDYEINWYHDESNSEESGISHLVIPRDSVHHSQRLISGCQNLNETFCRFRIPAKRGIEQHVYGLSFRDVLVPKLEQFLTQHARRVTGNVVIYDLLDSYKEVDMEAKYRIETNTTQYNARCLVDDDDWYGKLAEKANFYRKERSLNADIYKNFKNCFSRRPSYKQEDISKTKPLISIQALNNRTFYVFNRTNGNALRLVRRRNFIYIFRAVVVNTEFNTFTYCSNLDTFFVLQVANMASQRVALRWEFYSIVLVLVFVLVVCCYVYFARYKHWRTRIVTNRIFAEDIEAEEERQAQLEMEEWERSDPFQRASKKVANLKRFNEIAAEASAAARNQEDQNLKVERKPVTLDLLHQRISTISKIGDKKND